jgi:uncharacterized membrane protein
MSNSDSEVIVAKFDDSRNAQRALREVKKAMSQQQIAVREGAVIRRDINGGLSINDVRELGLGDVVRGATDLTLGLGRGGFGLALRLFGGAVGLAADGVRLALHGAWRAVFFAGAVIATPGRKLSSYLELDKYMQTVGEDLDPGTAAVILVVTEDPEGDLAETLVGSGGVLL